LCYEGRRNFRDYFQTQGYFDAGVEYTQTSDSGGDHRTITYDINKGERHKLTDLTIQGNKYFDVATIRERMNVTPATLFQYHGKFSQAMLARDISAIEALYRANGVDMDMEIALFHADHDKNMTETLALARKAYANRPSIHGADALAWALYKTGHYQEAQAYAVEALKLGTKDPLKLFHAGMIALKLGDKEQARQYLEEALSINPHFSILYAEEAQRTLDLLK